MHPGNKQVTLNTAGSGSIEISHSKAGLLWRIYQLSVSSNGAALTVYLTVNGFPHTTKVTGASPITASGGTPCDIGEHDTLNVVISDGGAGNTVVASWYYDEMLAGAA